MLAPLDIFLITKDGLMWKGTAENFDDALLSVKALMGSTPADYIVLSQRTGNKTIIKADGTVISPKQANVSEAHA